MSDLRTMRSDWIVLRELAASSSLWRARRTSSGSRWTVHEQLEMA